MSWSRSLFVFSLLLAVGCGSSGAPFVAPTAPPSIYGTTALSFDGVDDVATVAAPGGSFAFPNGVTLEAWIKPSSLPGPGDPLARFIGELGAPNLFFSGNGAGSVSFTVSTPATVGTSTPLQSIQTGVWQHVAGTYDGAMVRIYLNGVEVGSLAHPGMSNPINDLYVGNLKAPGNGVYQGQIDEIRVWNVGRTPSEIQAGMHQPVQPDAPGLLAYYRCEGVGQTLVDTSMNGADGGLGTDPMLPDASDPARVSPNGL